MSSCLRPGFRGTKMGQNEHTIQVRVMSRPWDLEVPEKIYFDLRGLLNCLHINLVAVLTDNWNKSTESEVNVEESRLKCWEDRVWWTLVRHKIQSCLKARFFIPWILLTWANNCILIKSDLVGFLSFVKRFWLSVWRENIVSCLFV